MSDRVDVACGIWWGPELVRRCGCYSAARYKTIAGAGVGALERARRELDDGERAKCRLNPPRPERLPRAPDVAVAVDENDVDRELHEERVDAAARREDQRRVVGEGRTPEKAAVAGLAVERRFDRPGHDVLVTGVPKDPGCARRREDRVQEAQDSRERRVSLGRSLPANGSPADVGRAPIGPGARNWR